MGRSGRRWRALLAAVSLGVVLNAVPAWAQEAPPPETPPTAPAVSVAGPVAPDVGRREGPLAAAVDPLDAHDYAEEEVFLAGTANAHGPAGSWEPDGEWAVEDGDPAPYRTRLLVRRPADPDDFDGTVFVSWLDVGGAFDLDPEWIQAGEELMRQGAAFVGVSAQTLAVEGPLGARRWDTVRYGELALGSDSLAYDVFTQAGQAIAEPATVDPLGGLPGERRLIASGHAQAAQRLVTYINAFHPEAQVYDGYLLVSRFRGAAPLGNATLPSRGVLDPDDAGPDDPLLPDPLVALLSGPPRAQVREDTDVPVFVVLTETEAVQNTRVGRPDSELFRTWEVAGAAHVDAVATEGTKAKLARDFPSIPLEQLDCPQANAFPTRYALRAAVRALAAWVAEGTPPPSASPLARDDDGQIRRDADGNALGGLRLPDVNVPTARHTGQSDRRGYCGLTGATEPFPAAELAARYPSPEGYVQAVTAAVDDAVAAGHLLPEDGEAIVASAADRFVSARAEAAGAPASAAARPGATPGAVPEATPGATPEGAQGGAAADPAAAPEAERADRGWMATTGRDLITPVLVGLLLLLNGRVVLTVAHQRRRGARSGPDA
jgi:hypothetical protein